MLVNINKSIGIYQLRLSRNGCNTLCDLKRTNHDTGAIMLIQVVIVRATSGDFFGVRNTIADIKTKNNNRFPTEKL